MSRTRTNKKTGNVQWKAYKALIRAKCRDFGVMKARICTQCPCCDRIFRYELAVLGINPDHQHIVTCPTCHKKLVKKMGKGIIKGARFVVDGDNGGAE